jgi:dimethylamine monooxygenase subunit A
MVVWAKGTTVLRFASVRHSGDECRETLCLRQEILCSPQFTLAFPLSIGYIATTSSKMRYLPFLNGQYSTAPGLTAMAKADDAWDRQVFQIDDLYGNFLGNKADCRKEDIYKYYLEFEATRDTLSLVNRYIVRRLTVEYPLLFIFNELNDRYTLENRRTGETIQWHEDWFNIYHSVYVSLFDALSCQVQEDLAICQLTGDRDWLAAIHLCAPNHWSPAEKIGGPFSAVHGVVPGMEKLNQAYFRMLETAVQKGPFFRFAWGIATDTRLNHHPVTPRGFDSVHWQGRRIGGDDGKFHLRVERQTINGLPACNAFLFTIRTYFYPIEELAAGEKKALLAALESMSPQSLEYKGLTDKLDQLRYLMS